MPALMMGGPAGISAEITQPEFLGRPQPQQARPA